jgi:imidazolonepropionase-like amidohydrolase
MLYPSIASDDRTSVLKYFLSYFQPRLLLAHTFLWAALITLAAVATQVASGATSEKIILIRNVSVVDVARNRVQPQRDVTILGAYIAKIQPGGKTRVPRHGWIIDGSGKFLMPGLWDFHVHTFSAEGEEDFALPLYVLNGVTGIRDAGAIRPLKYMRGIKAAIERGERVGPRLVLAGAMIDGPPGSWPGQMVAQNSDEARARVREAKAIGWEFIKSYSLLSESTYLGVAQEARQAGLPLYGHIPESVMLATAVKAGHRSIEHFGRVTQACSTAEAAMIASNVAALSSADPFPALMAVLSGHNKTTMEKWDAQRCAQVAQQLVQAGVAVMPSLMVSDFYLGKDPAPDDLRMRSVPLAVRAQWGQVDWRRQQMSAELLAMAPRSVALDWKTFKLMHDAGVKILAGTDAAYANPFLFHGYTLHDELARYVEAGLTPQQALMTATVNPGQFLKRSDLAGRVTAGQRADLVLLDENPLQDISATRRIHAVVANGRLFDRQTMEMLLRDIEARARSAP